MSRDGCLTSNRGSLSKITMVTNALVMSLSINVASTEGTLKMRKLDGKSDC